jgi:outer membrane protein TolC
LQVDGAKQSLSAARLGNAPALSLGGQLNGAAQTFPADTLRWSAGVTLSWNVFDGFLTAGEIKTSHGALQLAEANLHSVELSATQEVTDAVIALETAEEQVRLGETTVASATESRDVAVGRYQAGAGSQLEVTDAESQLHSAIVDLSNARYDLAQAKRDLWFVLGKNA